MKAWQLLDSREKWCQRVNARTKQGQETDIHGKDAACWCIYGAIEKCYGEDQRDVLQKLWTKHMFAATWNDEGNRTWEEVHALLKELDI